MAPARPKLVGKEAAELEYVTWDTFVEEATRDLTPYKLLLPGDDEPIEISCPTGAQMEALGAAQASMDDAAAAAAIFGEHADRILTLTAGLPFTVRARLFAQVMTHYGQSFGDLPES